MNVLEISHGCPSTRYPTNGIFQMDQATALLHEKQSVVFGAIDLRSARRVRKWGLSTREWLGVPVVECSIPIGPGFTRFNRDIGSRCFRKILDYVTGYYGKPDVVHVHFWNVAGFVANECVAKGIPYVVTEHSSSLIKESVDEPTKRALRNIYGKAGAVIAVSNELSNKIKEYSGITPAVIPNIVDTSIFNYREIERTEQIIAAGNLNKRKGFDTLLKSFNQFSKVHSEATLLIMGDGSERESLERYVAENDLGARVSFYGAYVREEFANELNRSCAFALTSRYETFGVVYAEALCSGVPVLATRCGGPEDFVDDSNGILVGVDNVEEIANALERLCEEKSYRNHRLIAEEAQKRFGARGVAESIINVFIEL